MYKIRISSSPHRWSFALQFYWDIHIWTNGLRLYTSIRTHSLFIMAIFPCAYVTLKLSFAFRFAMLNYVMSVILLQRIAIIVTTNILNLINRNFPYTIFVLHLQIANYTPLLHGPSKRMSTIFTPFLFFFCYIIQWCDLFARWLIIRHWP